MFERIGANGMPEKVEMSRLFAPHRSLVLYSFMYGPERNSPCPMCVRLLDSINGAASHVAQRASLYIVAKSPLARLVAWARQRGWQHLQFLSTAGNRYSADYFGDTSKLPAADPFGARHQGRRRLGRDHVQRVPARRGDRPPLLGQRADVGADGAGPAPSIRRRRHALWGMPDMTPECRGQFMPKLAY